MFEKVLFYATSIATIAGAIATIISVAVTVTREAKTRVDDAGERNNRR